MKHLIYEHRSAKKVIPADLQAEVKAAISGLKVWNKATPCRDSILETLRNVYGWCDETKISADAKISITSQKEEIGLCLQTGNMSRFYADLLKLEYLFSKEVIRAAIYVLPEKSLATEWGQNIANFDRFTKEIGIFATILNTPLFVIAIRRPL